MPDPALLGTAGVGWHPDVAIVALVAAAAYVVAARSLGARGRRWPPARVVAWCAGSALVLVAACPPLASRDERSFAAHALEHLLLGMAAPACFALARPVTLALQAGRRQEQRRVLRVLRSPAVLVLTHPLTAWILFALPFFALYLTPLYRATLTSPVLHALVHLHLLVAGTLFFSVVVGADPSHWRLPHPARLLYAFTAVPLHAVLGLALLTGGTPIAPGIGRADQRLGAGIMWSAGELLSLVAIGIVVVSWMAADAREAVRVDRRLDAADAADAAAAAAASQVPPT